jgi:hypothetical protein
MAAKDKSQAMQSTTEHQSRTVPHPWQNIAFYVPASCPAARQPLRSPKPPVHTLTAMTIPELSRLEVAKRLPVHLPLWVKGLRWDFDFSRSLASLRTIAPHDVKNCRIEDEWTVLYLFGEESLDGGASPYLGVHRDTGVVFGLDIERENSHVFLLNTDMDRFIRTIQKIEEFLHAGPLDRGMLSNALMEIDVDAFQRSEWRHFSSYVENGT